MPPKSKKNKEWEDYIDPELLPDNADFTDNEDLPHRFTEDELIKLKEDYFALSSEYAAREKIKSSVTSWMSMDIDGDELQEHFKKLLFGGVGVLGTKAAKKKLGADLEKINSGYEIISTKIYGLAHHEIGRMVIYHEDGHYLYDRPLRPDEKQATIMSMSRAENQ